MLNRLAFANSLAVLTAALPGFGVAGPRRLPPARGRCFPLRISRLVRWRLRPGWSCCALQGRWRCGTARPDARQQDEPGDEHETHREDRHALDSRRPVRQSLILGRWRPTPPSLPPPYPARIACWLRPSAQDLLVELAGAGLRLHSKLAQSVHRHRGHEPARDAEARAADRRSSRPERRRLPVTPARFSEGQACGAPRRVIPRRPAAGEAPVHSTVGLDGHGSRRRRTTLEQDTGWQRSR